MVWKAWLTRRTGQSRCPVFPKLSKGHVALTWIGHASFLIQTRFGNLLIDPVYSERASPLMFIGPRRVRG